MNEERLYDLIREKENIASVAFPSLMRKVYVWMTLALVITGFVAYGVASSPGIITALVSNKLLFWGLFIAELALVWTVSARINRLSLTTATLLFILIQPSTEPRCRLFCSYIQCSLLPAYSLSRPARLPLWQP